ncbi:MAG: glycosyltransferase [Planctomycetota bacterium]
MKLHLAILTYDALACTRRCRGSRQAHTTRAGGMWIVDNGSTDGTRAWLEGLDDPRVRVRLNDENRGVPGGRNDLLRELLPEADDDDLVVFLDNDLELGPGWDRPFRALFEARPTVGLAAKVGWAIRVEGDTRVPLVLPDEAAPVDIASGGFACCARVRALRDVGRMDENLGIFYHEDDDWSLRFAGAGWEVWCVPEAPVVHHEHATGVAWEALEDGRSARNLAYLATKWRAMGLVDDEGWPVHRDPLLHPAAELRDALARRVGRRLGRGEYARVHHDLLRLERCEAEGRPFDRPRSPGLGALLTVLAGGAAGYEPARAARLAALAGFGPEAGGAAPDADAKRREAADLRAPGGWARVEDFDEPGFRAMLAALDVDDGDGDWFLRRGLDWARARALVVLDEAGLCAPGRRGLIVPRGASALAEVVAGTGAAVCLCVPAGTAPTGPTVPGIEHHDLAALGDERFDFVLIEDCGDGPERAAVLRFVAQRLSGGGLALLVGERRAGGATPDDDAPAAAGLAHAGPREERPSAATIASAWQPGRVGHGPTLCARVGDELRAGVLDAVTPAARPLAWPARRPQRRQPRRTSGAEQDGAGLELEQHPVGRRVELPTELARRGHEHGQEAGRREPVGEDRGREVGVAEVAARPGQDQDQQDRGHEQRVAGVEQDAVDEPAQGRHEPVAGLGQEQADEVALLVLGEGRGIAVGPVEEDLSSRTTAGSSSHRSRRSRRPARPRPAMSRATGTATPAARTNSRPSFLAQSPKARAAARSRGVAVGPSRSRDSQTESAAAKPARRGRRWRRRRPRSRPGAGPRRRAAAGLPAPAAAGGTGSRPGPGPGPGSRGRSALVGRVHDGTLVHEDLELQQRVEQG